MNRDLLALPSLRSAVGSEWRHKKTSAMARLAALDESALTVQVQFNSSAAVVTWGIGKFLKEFKSPLPPEKIPTWYQRLLEDRLV